MDDELRHLLATLSDQIAAVDTKTSLAVSLGQDNRRETAGLAYEVRTIRGDVDQLKTAVFGSGPPPAPAAPAVVQRITHNEGDVAELAGQVIAVKADVLAVKTLNEEQSEKIATIEANQAKAAEERAQTADDVRAIKGAVVGVVTDKRVRFVGRVIFGAAVLYAAGKGIKVLP